MPSHAVVAGVGMIPFVKPGTSEPYHVMGAEAARRRSPTPESPTTDRAGLRRLRLRRLDRGPAALYRLGLTGIPVFNVNNNCSTGSTALFLARQAVGQRRGRVRARVGFEQMSRARWARVFNDRPNPLEDFLTIANEAFEGATRVPLAAALFGGAGREYHAKYGTATRPSPRSARRRASTRRTTRTRCSARR